MKIVVLFGSPKKDGHTAGLLNMFLNTLKADKALNYSIEFFNSYDLMAKPCYGCNYCKEENLCINDDLDGLMSSLSLADLIIIASPVYYYSFPAPLKAVIDRLERFYKPELGFEELKNQRKTGKGILLATAGSSGKFSFDIIKKQAHMAFMVLQKDFIGTLMLADTDTKDMDKSIEAEIEKLYQKIIKQ